MVLLKMLMKIALPKMGELLVMMMTMGENTTRENLIHRSSLVAVFKSHRCY